MKKLRGNLRAIMGEEYRRVLKEELRRELGNLFLKSLHTSAKRSRKG